MHRIWQLPQYAVVSAGEVMFAVTGLEFAYSQVHIWGIFHSFLKRTIQGVFLIPLDISSLIQTKLSTAWRSSLFYRFPRVCASCSISIETLHRSLIPTVLRRFSNNL